LIFQDAGRRHLGFLNFCNFNGQNAQKGETASPYQMSSKSVKLRPKYGDFSFSKTAAAAILDFQNFKFLTAGRLNIQKG